MAVCSKSKAVKTQTTLAAFFASVGQEKNFSKITGFFPHPIVQWSSIQIWHSGSCNLATSITSFGISPALNLRPSLLLFFRISPARTYDLLFSSLSRTPYQRFADQFPALEQEHVIRSSGFHFVENWPETNRNKL